MRVGIDASNLRGGGGLTHLVELLAVADPPRSGVESVVVWGGAKTLALLSPRPWLRLVHEPALDGTLPQRVWWQNMRLDRLAREACDILFVPGGQYLGGFRPFVTMSRNLLPFDLPAARAYGLSWAHLRVQLLRRTQTRSLRNADGVIFLTETAQRIVQEQTGALSGATTVIPHGVSARFRCPPAERRARRREGGHPFRWIYVSTVDVYKHQVEVVEAIGCLRNAGYDVTLDLVGGAYPPELRRLRRVMERVDPAGRAVRYRGPLPHATLAEAYHECDGAVFASACENLPNILIESMAAGLPVASSHMSVMPEVLGMAGIYFDPRDVDSIVRALQRLLDDEPLRQRCAEAAYARAADRSWVECANRTFDFLATIRAQVSVASPVPQ